MSENPSSARNRAPSALRTRSTFSKSTSLAMKACGDVDLDRTMCSAVRRRTLENGTTRSLLAGTAAMDDDRDSTETDGASCTGDV